MNYSPRVSVERVSPREARAYLDTQGDNRNLRPYRVAEFASTMIRGEWMLNGQALIFDGEDRLMDGQHRLQAVIEANIIVEFLVVRGIGRDAMSTLDRGSKRTVADSLKINGYLSATNLSAALVWLNALQLGPAAIRQSSARKLTPTQALALAAVHPDLGDCVRRYSGSKSFRRICPNISMWTAFAYLLETELVGDKATERAQTFTEKAFSGVGLGSRDPILTLREKWMQVKENNYSRTGIRVSPLHLMIYIIRSWNAHYSGQELSRLQLPRMKSSSVMPIPRIRGWRRCAWPISINNDDEGSE